MTEFRNFLASFPRHEQPDCGTRVDVSSKLVEAFGAEVPQELSTFWGTLSPGYYGENELYFFGPTTGERNDIITWNKLDCWSKVLPNPREGGPIFFADTCFGEQLGFRWVNGKCIPVLCILDSMESFVLGNDFSELFDSVLANRFGITDPERYTGVVQRLGRLPNGKHFAPKISPLLGGSGSPENFHVVDPVVHVTSCAALYSAMKAVPDDSTLGHIGIEFED